MGIIDDLRAFLINKGYVKNSHAVADDQPLLSSGLIDSLAVLELTSYIQQVYSLQIEEDDLVPENFDSLAAMKSYIDRKTAAR